MSNNESSDNKIWGIVHSGPLTFIGVFSDYDISFRSREYLIDDIKNTFENGRSLRLSPVFELMAPLQQVRQQTPKGERVGVAKSPLPMPYGFTTGSAAIYVRPDAIVFLDEMSKEDKAVYMAYAKTVAEAELAERAARSGIELATNLNGGARA